MPGKIKRVIQEIIEKRSRGNETIRSTTRTRLVLKGVNPDHFTDLSEDDPLILDKLKEVIDGMGLDITVND